MEKDTTKNLNLWQKISKIMSEVNYVQKKMTVGEGRYSYKGLSSKDLYEKINESMVKWGVVCVQKSFEFERFYYEGKGWDNYNKREKATFQREIIGTYNGELINVDNPTERQNISAVGQGIDSQDKASGKAQTYALKQALLNTFIIATGIDTDNTHSDKLNDDFSSKKPKEEEQKPFTPPINKENPQIPKKEELNESHKHFKAVCDGLKEKKTTVEKLLSKYIIPQPVLLILNKI